MARKSKTQNSGRLYYLAYGSNLNIAQMLHRCPKAKMVGKTQLIDYRLRFCGSTYYAVANVEPARDYYVPVIIWDITKSDENSLDSYEGCPFLYRKTYMDIALGSKDYHVMLYLINKQNPRCDNSYGIPADSYLKTIKKGYQDAGFDEKLIEEAVAASNVKPTMTDTIKEQIMFIRDTGRTNMFDIKTVKHLASEIGYYELVAYLDENRAEYGKFIMTGKIT